MFPAAEKAQRLAVDLHAAMGQRRPSSAPGTRPIANSSSGKFPPPTAAAAATAPAPAPQTDTDRRAHMSKMDYMRHMLMLEREARKKDQKTVERQAKTIAMLTDHLERLMGGMRAYAEMKLHADAKVHALRHSCQRLRTVIDKQQLSISVHHQLIASLRDTGGMLERQLSDMDRRYDDLRGKLLQAKKQHAAALAAAAAASSAGDGAARQPTTASESERPRPAPGGFKSSAAWPGASTSATTLGIVSPPPSPTPQQARQEARVKRRKDQQVATDVVPALPADAAAPLVSLPPGLQDDAEEGARGDFYTGGRYSFSRPGTGTSPGADDAEEAKWLQFLVSTPPGEDGGDGGGDGDVARSAARPGQAGGEGEGSIDGGPFSAVKWYDAERARRDGASFQPAATGAARTHLPTDGDGNGDGDGDGDGVIGSPESASASRRRLSKVVAHVSTHARLSLSHTPLPASPYPGLRHVGLVAVGGGGRHGHGGLQRARIEKTRRQAGEIIYAS